jgi:hypothetical protein
MLPADIEAIKEAFASFLPKPEPRQYPARGPGGLVPLGTVAVESGAVTLVQTDPDGSTRVFYDVNWLADTVPANLHSVTTSLPFDEVVRRLNNWPAAVNADAPPANNAAPADDIGDAAPADDIDDAAPADDIDDAAPADDIDDAAPADDIDASAETSD